MSYRLATRGFSREWRRNKSYSRHELRWLARERGLDFKDEGRRGVALHRGKKEVVRFYSVAAPEPARPPAGTTIIIS